MAAAKKSVKRSAAKKRPAAKGGSTRKKATRKTAKPKATQAMTRQARKGLKAAWKTLKSTTAQVVEGVKETFAGETPPPAKSSRSR